MIKRRRRKKEQTTNIKYIKTSKSHQKFEKPTIGKCNDEMNGTISVAIKEAEKKFGAGSFGSSGVKAKAKFCNSCGANLEGCMFVNVCLITMRLFMFIYNFFFFFLLNFSRKILLTMRYKDINQRLISNPFVFVLFFFSCSY